MMAAVRLNSYLSAFRCPDCRRSILNSIATPSATVATFNSTSQWHPEYQKQRRTLHNTSRRRNQREDLWAASDAYEAPPKPPKSDLEALEESVGLQEKEERKKPAPSRDLQVNKTKPWYLRDQPPEPQVNPFAERQKMPDLPQNPPPILEPLLKQLSIDLGLDYLSIVDLRSVDPPPAFGANLLMIFGSARSEKHLNTSADRLCRWLRTTYKLVPYADGLLGRNEMKLKMKRKNKKNRTLSAAGSYAASDPDDGITTGWVCVNVGEVEGGILPGSPQDPIDNPGFIGFGTRSHGAKIVIQMMTEIKRGEIDLEGLWQGMVDRAKRVEAGERRAREKEEKQLLEEDGRDPSAFDPIETDRIPPRYTSRQQTRTFHTTARMLETTISEDYDSTSQTITSDIHDSQPFLRSIQHSYAGLLSMTPQEALEALGKGQDDKSSTPFLQNLNAYRWQPKLRSADDMKAAVQLQCYAIDIGHPGYDRQHAVNLLLEMQACGYHIPYETCFKALRTTLSVHNIFLKGDKVQANPAKEARAIVRTTHKLAKEIFHVMEMQGYDVAARPILAEIHSAICFPRFTHENALITQHLLPQTATSTPGSTLSLAYAGQGLSEDKYYEGSYGVPRAEISTVFRNVVETLYVPEVVDTPQGYDSVLFKLMLRSYRCHKSYSCFWALWSQLPRGMRARDAEMYVILLGMVQEGIDVDVMRQILMEIIPDMGVEEPPVLVQGDVASTLRGCLITAGVHRGMGEPWRGYWKMVDDALEVESGSRSDVEVE